MSDRRLYAPGTLLWVQDTVAVWKRAKVIETFEIEGGHRVKIMEEGRGGEERTLKPNAPVHLCNAEDSGAANGGSIESLDDLTQLTFLHEPAVLDALERRFNVDQIYTFTGPILIAVNPFKTIPLIYDNANIRSLLQQSENSPHLRTRVPHVFATGANAFRGLCESEASQTILISGESGAGKTESTKFVMKILAVAGSEDWFHPSQTENQVLQSNPLLEAFGNAKTLRNDNSSRFGKFIEMQFLLKAKSGSESLVGRLAGARIQTYLLETVRVCHQLEGERNYHSFYQLCSAAAAAGENGKYQVPTLIDHTDAMVALQEFDLSKFRSFEHFRCLTKSSCSRLARMNDVEEFENTVTAMQTVGIPHDDQVCFWNVVGAVLYLGNVQFEAAQGDSESSALTNASRPSFELAASLLEVAELDLQKALTFRVLTAQSETYEIPLKVKEAEEARDALAKALYGTLFLNIVRRTNESIGYRDDVKLFCGVLDIFGFECFTFNSFEQLCINFTNERLQQFFNNFIFSCEEVLYKNEGVPWTTLDFPDNADCVDLIDQKGSGMFAMLDEECLVPRGSDQGYCNKMKDKHKSNCRFASIKTKPEWFTVRHFAGPVSYCVAGFLDKNRDQLSLEIQQCIKSSSSKFVSNLFIEFLNRGEDKGAKKQTKTTVSSEFRSQLNFLMETVAQTSPHFIRCIKPNSQNIPNTYERKCVTEQLRCGGVLQAVEVSRAGYPVRLPHRDIYLDYRHLCSKEALLRAPIQSLASDKDRAETMMTHLDECFHFPIPAHSAKSWAVGETLVFLKHECYEVLSSQRASLRATRASYIQARWKGWLARKQMLRKRACSILIQAHMWGALARRRALRLRQERAAIKIQSLARCALARSAYVCARASIIAIQSSWRIYKERLRIAELRKNAAAIRIQTTWRGYKTRRNYQRLLRSAILSQMCWRRILAKRKLRRLRQEQKEAAFLLSQIVQLQEENKVMKAEKERLAGKVSELEQECLVLRTSLHQVAQSSVSTTDSPTPFLEDPLSPHPASHQQLEKQRLEQSASPTDSDSTDEPSPMSPQTVTTACEDKLEQHHEEMNPLPPYPSSSALEEGMVGIPTYTFPGAQQREPRLTKTPSTLLYESASQDYSHHHQNHDPSCGGGHAQVPPGACRRKDTDKLPTGALASEHMYHHRDQHPEESIVQEQPAPNGTVHSPLQQTLNLAEVLMERDALSVQVQKLEAIVKQQELMLQGGSRVDAAVMTIGVSGSMSDEFRMADQDAGTDGTESATTGTRVDDGIRDRTASIDVLIIGDSNSGKSELVHRFADKYGRPCDSQNTPCQSQQQPQHTEQPDRLKCIQVEFHQQSLLIAELMVETDEEQDCTVSSAVDHNHNSRMSMIQRLMLRSHYVVIVYHVTSGVSHRYATQYIQMTAGHGQRLCLGNRVSLSSHHPTDIADAPRADGDLHLVDELKACVACSRIHAVEASDLAVVLDLVWPTLLDLRTKANPVGSCSALHSLSRGSPTLRSVHADGHLPSTSSFLTPVPSSSVSLEAKRPSNNTKERITNRPLTPSTPRAFGVALNRLQTFLGLGKHKVSGTPQHQHPVICTTPHILAPSMDGMQQSEPSSERPTGDEGLQPVEELSNQTAAVTCMAFGREREHRDFYLLAVGCKDGKLIVYRLDRTETEKQMWVLKDGADGTSCTTQDGVGPAHERENSQTHLTCPHTARDDGMASTVVPVNFSTRRSGKATVLMRLPGHAAAILHLFFSYQEDQLVTASGDKSVCFWSLETGTLLKRFDDSTACRVAAYIPSHPHTFIVGNANATLRVVDFRNGQVLQKLKAESSVWALTFDDRGSYCYAGTQNGTLHVLESIDIGNIEFRFKERISKCSISSITFVPSTLFQGDKNHPSRLIVNSCDSTISIVDCIYQQPPGTSLTTILIRKCLKVQHSILPLHSCYSHGGGGWLISGSEDNKVYLYNLEAGGNYKRVLLSRHQAPVVTVAVNQLNTVLVSADANGKIILWRYLHR